MDERHAITVGVVGKGGVGKTTIAGLLARGYTSRGQRVVAIDTDSNPNLGLSLGLSLVETEAVPVLPRAMIVGTGGDSSADALVVDYGRPTPAGPILLSAIRVAEAGAGCTCGGHATVRSLLADALTDVDVTLVDMEAGLEHLSRSGGTLAHADVLVVVCEPTRKSVLTAVRTAALASELGIPHVLAVGNKARDEDDSRYLAAALRAEQVPLAAVFPYDSTIPVRDRAMTSDLSEIDHPTSQILTGLLGAIDTVAATPVG